MSDGCRRRFVAWIGLACGIAVGCARDERAVQLVVDSGSEGAGVNAPGSGETTDIGMLQAAPELEVTPSAVELGAVTVGFASRARLRISNSGDTALAAPTVAWSADSSADYAIIQNQCLSEVPPGESCELRVQVVPSRTGVTGARLEISAANADSLSVPFSVEGMEPGDLILAPAVGTAEDFGGVRIGSTVEGTFTLSSAGTDLSGTLSFRVNRPEFVVLPAAEGECVPGTTELSNGQACPLRVAFTPSERGPIEATLTATAAAEGSVSINLSGRGLVPGVLQAPVTTLDFQGVVLGSSALGTVRFENAGDEALIVAGARVEPEAASEFSIRSSDCAEGSELAGGASCQVEIEFRPTVADEARSAELVVGSTGSDALRVGLSGIGLQPGALVLTASIPGEEDFGDVLLDQSLTRVFEVTNPTPQPSGVLTLRATGAFELLTPPEEGDCIDGSTSLVNGETCAIRVRFQPSERRAESGTLTVLSALAGATSLTLSGRGIAPARFDLVPEVNFGRVLTNASAERVLTLKNAGDQPLPPPAIEITGTPAQAAAFSFASTCAQPLGFDEECALTLTFDPSDPVPHSANLRLSADSAGTATVLLLGEALAPGSLVVAAANGSGPDYGDVQIGTTVSRQFTLTNPGDVPSGLVTITTDDNRFTADPGNCNQGQSDGLVDGSSCTFSVAFTPDDSTQVAANISIQSPGAGRAGLEIRGRGRRAALLTAVGNRDLGRANIGQDALTQSSNEFTWTVNNEGDLASGSLQVTNDNAAEFAVRNDSCNNAQIPGRSSCQMTIRFRPSATGTRNGRITVTDAAASRSLTLVLTGLGVRLAALGESCVNATCAAGVCTRGVCCDRACDRTCQVCSAAGVCTDQDAQQQCGNGNARCFGVDQCLLPAGQACGADTDCGGDLDCKACTSGGRQCTAPAACCGQCPGNQSCVNGTCGCTAQQISCGGGLCIPRNTSNVCCPASPQCPASLPACTSDGRCVACLQNSQCGECRTCSANNTCVPVADGTQCSGNGRCNASGQCVPQAPASLVTEVAPFANLGQALVQRSTAQSSWTIKNEGAVPTGSLVASQQQEFALSAPCLGQPLAAGASCIVTITLAPTAPGPKSARLTISGGAGVSVQVDVTGDARVADGDPCPNENRSFCESARCTEWFVDGDGDGFGAPEAVGGHPSLLLCGDGAASNRPPPLTVAGCRGGAASLPYVTAPSGRVDCCDNHLGNCANLGTNEVRSSDVFPGQTIGFTGIANCGGRPARAHDFNCDGQEQVLTPPDGPHPACGAIPNAISAEACSARSGFTAELQCGVLTSPQGCGIVQGLCAAVTGIASSFPICL